MGGGISAAINFGHSSSPRSQNITDPQRYKMNSLIGCGGSSSVYHAIDQLNDQSIALKCVHLKGFTPLAVNEVVNLSLTELKILKRLETYPFIVGLHAAYTYQSTCYFALDYLGGGDLRRLLQIDNVLNEESIAYIIGCTGSALHHLHTHGIIHRDVKPENIIFDLNGRPHLTDFGISMLSSDANSIPICTSSSGTSVYLAPEVLTPSNHHSYQADFWSLGVLAYELAFRQRPFEKHCPVLFIKFSAREYSPMWKQLATKSACTLIDFESIYNTTLNQNRQLFPDLNVRLNEDGSRPESLRVHLQDSSLLSDELSSLLDGLLDVRIHSRLGNMANYSLFSEHSFFRKHSLSSTTLHRISSPLISHIVPVELVSTVLVDPHVFDDIDLPLSTEIKLRLAEFSYESMDEKCLSHKSTKSESSLL